MLILKVNKIIMKMLKFSKVPHFLDFKMYSFLNIVSEIGI